MPQLRDIEEFKSSLSRIGKESEILDRWGEVPIDDPLPEEGVPSDLAALMSDSLGAVEAESQAGGPSPDDLLDDSGDDFTSFLQDINLDADDTAAGTSDDQTENQVLDLDAFAGLDTSNYNDIETDASDGILPEDTAFPELTDPVDTAMFDEALEAFADEPEVGSDQEAGDSASDLNQFDLPDDFGLPESTGADANPGSVPEGDIAGDDNFGLPDDFGLPEEADFAEASAEFEQATEPEEASFLEEPKLDSQDEAQEELAPLDDFESFDLGGTPPPLPDLDELDLGGATFGGGASMDDLDNQLAALDSAPIEADNFSIDNSWGNDFHIPGFEMKAAEDAVKPTKQLITDAPDAFRTKADSAAAIKPIALNEEQVDAMQDTLLSYPLNLRLAIEDILANDKGTAEQQNALVWMLVEGESAREAAKIASRIFKRTIQVPAGYEKRTGAALEAEKGTFGWIFRHNILPALQIIVLVAAGLGLLTFLGYNFAFRPIYANYVYSQGYKQLQAGNYPQSRTYFEKADRYWIFKRWYYRYANGYVEHNQYDRAAEFYHFILRRWPREAKAALQWARMELEHRYNFNEVERILTSFILNRDYFNKDALLLMAHNYLNWADYEEQKYDGGNSSFIVERYERARLQLASLMEKYGQQDAYLELLMLYLIRLEYNTAGNNLALVLPLADYYLANIKRSQFSAASLAELAAYLVSHGQRDRVYDILMSAWSLDEYLPELHVAGAAWYNLTNMPDRERGALENAVFSFGRLLDRSPLAMTPRRQQNYIRSMIRLSELRKSSGEFLDTEAILVQAIDEYERAVRARRFRAAAEFGKAYSHLADLYYERHGNYRVALAEYAKAEQHGYVTPQGDYRRGFIYYDMHEGGSRNYVRALEYFYRAGLDSLPSNALMLATANTLYQRGDWFAAQSYYSQLLSRLQRDLSNISQPRPQERDSHGELVEMMMVTRNNLGAALYRIGQRMGDPSKRAEAMYSFSESARLYDSLSRDQMTMIRSDTKNLGYLNLDFVLHPTRGIDIGIYPEIKSDM